MGFPDTPDSFADVADHVDPVESNDINPVYDAIVAIETKLGVDGSVDTDSIDYKLKSTDSENPGHEHTEVQKDMDHNDHLILQAALRDYAEIINALAGTSGALAIDLTLGNVVTLTVAGDVTLSFTNPPATGRAGAFTLFLTNGGSATVNWPASVRWAGGAPPALTAAGIDILIFTTIDGGTTWHGMIASVDSKAAA